VFSWVPCSFSFLSTLCFCCVFCAFFCLFFWGLILLFLFLLFILLLFCCAVFFVFLLVCLLFSFVCFDDISFIFLCPTWSLLPDCPFLITSSVFPNGYISIYIFLSWECLHMHLSCANFAIYLSSIHVFSNCVLTSLYNYSVYV
jgi:hypothetical protein